MRDCVFLLADSNMAAAFEGFLERAKFYQSLECGVFQFNARHDVVVASGANDPGLYTRGHELLRPYQKTHHHAVLVLDAEWEGSPGAETIATHLTALIKETGWADDMFKVIVIDPELENWIWQKNEHVAIGLGFETTNDLLCDPDLKSAWPEDQAKPSQPKEILEKLLRKKRIPRSSSIYRGITERVSVRACQDDAFQALVNTLRTWFPQEQA